MDATSNRIDVGVRDLRSHLSRYLERVRCGDEVIVTYRGRPVARLAALDHPTDRLAELIAAGVVRRAPRSSQRAPTGRVRPSGSVADLVADQRR